MGTYRPVIASLAFTALTACIHGRMEARPFVGKEAQPASSSGYVGAVTSRATMVRFGFGLREESTHEDYVLAFQDDGVSLIELPPGKYRVVFWTTASLFGETLTRSFVPETTRLGRPFELRPGAVVMLGKWNADREIHFGGNAGNTFIIKPSSVNAEETAAALREAYPAFANAPVECRACTQ